MQTTHTTMAADIYGSFRHTRTLSVRRRPGMSGAYVRHRITPIDGAPVRREDTGWIYHNNFRALSRWASQYGIDLFEVLYPG